MNNENKLPEDFKKRWVEALRSGEYKQCKGFLHKEDDGLDEYCCLGVAYKIEKGINPPRTKSGYIDGANIDTDGLPKLIVGTGANDTGLGHEVRFALTSMNDRGIPFSEIADYIEANL